jgi:hypothetical protein
MAVKWQKIKTSAPESIAHMNTSHVSDFYARMDSKKYESRLCGLIIMCAFVGNLLKKFYCHFHNVEEWNITESSNPSESQYFFITLFSSLFISLHFFSYNFGLYLLCSVFIFTSTIQTFMAKKFDFYDFERVFRSSSSDSLFASLFCVLFLYENHLRYFSFCVWLCAGDVQKKYIIYGSMDGRVEDDESFEGSFFYVK